MNMMMKRTPNLLKRSGALLLLAVLLLPACREGAQNPTLVLSDGIRFCESTYPYRDGVLVANFGTESLNPLNDEGKGYILYVTPERSEVVIPATGALSAPKGMFLRDDHLFVCDVNRVVVFNLARPEAEPQVVRLPEGELFVNDLVADGNVLYASVTNTGRIFRFDISDLDAVGAPEAWLDVPGANGMLLHDGALYVVSYPADGVTTPANVVYRIGALDNPVAERFIELPGQYDGIALSTDGRALVVSNWAPASLARIDLESRAVTPVTLELEQPRAPPRPPPRRARPPPVPVPCPRPPPPRPPPRGAAPPPLCFVCCPVPESGCFLRRPFFGIRRLRPVLSSVFRPPAGCQSSSSRSGRSARVRARDCSSCQRAISAKLPERSTSGTRHPRNSAGRV